MFAASIILCASLNGAADMNRCIVLKDTWGPYLTVQECEDRASTMVSDVMTNPIISVSIFASLGNPEGIISTEVCVKDTSEFAA